MAVVQNYVFKEYRLGEVFIVSHLMQKYLPGSNESDEDEFPLVKVCPEETSGTHIFPMSKAGFEI